LKFQQSTIKKEDLTTKNVVKKSDSSSYWDHPLVFWFFHVFSKSEKQKKNDAEKCVVFFFQTRQVCLGKDDHLGHPAAGDQGRLR